MSWGTVAGSVWGVRTEIGLRGRPGGFPRKSPAIQADVPALVLTPMALPSRISPIFFS